VASLMGAPSGPVTPPAAPGPPDDGLSDLDAAPSAPPVVVVVVTHDAGPWLEGTLEAVGAQDYPNLSVLVIDAASAEDPTTRVAACLPAAYVRRLGENSGFAAAANDVLGVVEGASHYVFLHDDAAPDPDAVRLMVEEAFRSNAGIVSPKMVEWGEPGRLLAVGASADKGGAVRPYGRHELDQEQHDAVRDVFVAPGGCTLVRADLFETLGGFDAGIGMFGEDLDLSWRAQVLGARVVVAPGARVRHVEATFRGERPLELTTTTGDLAERVARLQFRHRLRAVAKNYSALHLVRVLPQLVMFMAVEAVIALFSGHRRLAGAVVDAWRWNAGTRRDLRTARRSVQTSRVLRDSEVRRLQDSRNVRLSSALQGGIAVEERTFGMGAASRQFGAAVASGGTRLTVGVWLGVLGLFLIGSRHLLSGALPAIGQFATFPSSPFGLLAQFVSGWRTSGLGGEAAAPPAFAFLGIAGVVVFGAMGALQKLVVLGMVPAGLIGLHRLTAPLGSWRARLVGVVLYAAVPLPYDAIAHGRWAAIVSYAAAPWILSRLLRATGLAPFGAPAPDEPGRRQLRARARSRRPIRTTAVEAVEDLLGAEAGTMDAIDTEEFRVAVAAVAGQRASFEAADQGSADVESDPWLPASPAQSLPGWLRRPRSLTQQIVAMSVVLAVGAAIVPGIALATLLIALGLLVGGVILGDLRASARPLVVAAAAIAGAAALLVPWSLEMVLPGSTWASLAGIGPSAALAPSLADIVRFGAGPFGGTPLAWALLASAALPLVVGRRWRFTWAARLWLVAATIWAVAWASGRGWLLVAPPAVDVLLAPAACALVLCVVLGLAAFETDLPGYRFGWPQLASIAAAAAAVLATMPVLAGTIDGAWKAPRHGFARQLSWMASQRDAGDFRVLWAGAAANLPLDSWRLDDGLAYGSSRGGTPVLADLWPAADQGATGLLADALNTARRGETSRLGHLLAPLGVRYLAVPLREAPGKPPTRPEPAPDDLLGALRAQVDLKLVATDPSIVVYENAAWAPMRSVLPAAAVASSTKAGESAARTTELAGSAPALRHNVSATHFAGRIPAAGDVLVAEAYSPRWHLESRAGGAPHRKAFGWANAFTVRSAGPASLRYQTSPIRYASLAFEGVVWLLAIRFLIRTSRRDRLEMVA